MPSVYHVFAYKFKPETSPEQRNAVKSRVLSFPAECKKEGKPYILVRKLSLINIAAAATLNLKGGHQTNRGFISQGIDLVFVIEIASEEGRHYYHKEDTYHRGFIPSFIEHSAGGFGLDFAD